ncbi:GrpB family protein [Lolliginicoccus levis]|uniref:GrpB family protein n=1 Tax=Lolliginicoccus levis TaxID=2919542 RepID=UPI00241FC8B2|nr:GrpB family protein [Lolliginicoccus levis]
MTGEAELIGGIEKRDIRLVPHDSVWFSHFGRERDRIALALGGFARRIDHIGSTSVAGLAAKPIIDINVSVVEPEDEDTYLPQLEAVEYVLRVREFGHRMFRTPDLGVHVHVCKAGSDWERRHLLFRDWLRRSDSDRDLYGSVKHDLASRDWSDMNAYAAAKTDVIAAIMPRAEAWARTIGWSVAGS